jgi:uncharacterized glyoxalase superfamily protein PhnB
MKKVIPMFHVPDVRQTIDWYADIGFEVTATYGDGGAGLSFAMLKYGAGEVMFSSGGGLSAKRRREVDLYVYADDVETIYERIKDRVEVVEGPHNMFYGMREVIIRDLNGFWITFGQSIPQEELTPWPAVPAEQLGPYAGLYKSADGQAVRITIVDGRLTAFPQDGPGVYLRPSADHTFVPVMSEPAAVSFDMASGAARGLTFTQRGRQVRFARAT